MERLIAVISFGTEERVNFYLLEHGLLQSETPGSALFGVHVWADHYFWKAGLVSRGSEILGGVLDDSRYVSCARICHCLAKFAKNAGVEDITIYCAPQLSKRVARDLSKMLPGWVNFSCKECPADAEFYYSSDSAHPSTRNSVSWWCYEIPVLALSFLAWRFYAKKAGLTEAELAEVRL